MKKKILLFGSIATVFAVGIGTVVASGIGQLDKLVATPNYTEHKITFTAEHAHLNEESSAEGYFDFYVEKENATMSGETFGSTNGMSYVYFDGPGVFGGSHIFTASSQYDYASVGMMITFDFLGVAEYDSVVLNGTFIDSNKEKTTSISFDNTFFKDDEFSWYTSYSEQYYSMTLDSIVITYRCA